MKKERKPDISQELFEQLCKVYKETEDHTLPAAKKYKKGETIYQEGQIPRGVFYLRSGLVKITHDSYKKPVTIRYAISPDFVGYLSLLKHWDYVTTATAVDNCEVCFIPRNVFEKVIHCDNRSTNALIDILCTRITDTDRELLHMLTREVPERLALLLLSLNHCKANEPGHIDGIITIPKKELAAILNISAETLSRNLSRLSKEKAIKVHNKKSIVEIISKQKLLHLSHLMD
ncbi:MAG TPA: Crp/Fnr family transcriptional regulator [Puia sp.]|nr:Crp/Fnr family transcriptional regulator [Puia sp.]